MVAAARGKDAAYIRMEVDPAPAGEPLTAYWLRDLQGVGGCTKYHEEEDQQDGKTKSEILHNRLLSLPETKINRVQY